MVRVERDGHRARLEIDGRIVEVDVREVSESGRSLIWKGRHVEVAVRHLGGDRYRVSGAFGSEEIEVLDPLAHLALQTHAGVAGDESAVVTAYMPGKVVEVLVAAGETVEVGQGVLILEAMKMENEIQAERAGTVRGVFVEAGIAVEAGDRLYEIG